MEMEAGEYAMITTTTGPGSYRMKGRLEADSSAHLSQHLSRKRPVPSCVPRNLSGVLREVRPGLALAILLLLTIPATLIATELKPETLQAWDAYVHAAEARMMQRASGKAPFLWVDERPYLAQRVRAGEIAVEPAGGESPHAVPRGLIHDWVGAVFIPKASLNQVASLLDDYAKYEDIYRSTVAKARLVEQCGGYEKVTMLMAQKAFSVTGAVEIDDEVQTTKLDADRIYSLSTSTRVQEIAGYGGPHARVLPEDHGPGYVWRTSSVTRLEQSDRGVYVEMEMIGMSRGIPLAFRWLIEPVVELLPRSMLATILRETRDAVNREIASPPLNAQATVPTVPRRDATHPLRGLSARAGRR